MPSAPLEFTPELTQDFYNKLARPIQQQGAADVGTARSESLARGLTGDPFEAQMTGAARANTANQLSDTWANMNYAQAGLQEQERMTGQQNTWQAEQSALNRQTELQMAAQGYANTRDLLATQNRYAQQQAPWNILGSAVGTAGGIAAGRAI